MDEQPATEQRPRPSAAAMRALEQVHLLRPLAAELLASLYEHRLMSSRQLHELHCPHAQRQYPVRSLRELRQLGLVASTNTVRGEGRLWFLTDAGAEAVAAAPGPVDRRRRPAPGRAVVAVQLRKHTLLTNEVGVVLARWAQQHGDDFGPLGWRNEVAHRGLITDAVARYSSVRGRDVVFAEVLVELDRGTEPSQSVAAKLRGYAQYRSFVAKGERTPAWQVRYPSFPPIVLVFADQQRAQLERRRDLVALLCQTDPMLVQAQTDGMRILLCILPDLDKRGPYAPIFLDPNLGREVDLFLHDPEPPMPAGGHQAQR